MEEDGNNPISKLLENNRIQDDGVGEGGSNSRSRPIWNKSWYATTYFD